jgi:predicted permease
MNQRRFARRAQRDADLQREIALHLQEEIAENLARGMQSDEARRQAYLKFGSPQRVREVAWQQNSHVVIETFARDLCHAMRRLAKSPTTVLTVAISLGLGIAANLFIFTAVNKLVLQGPPVGDPARLLNLYPTTHHGQRFDRFTQQMLDDLRGQTRSFSGMAAYDVNLPATIGGQSEPEREWGQSVTVNFFQVADLPIVLGRGFLANEDREPVVVLSNSLWRRYFHQDAGIIGKTISLSGARFTVVGVTAPGFRGINKLFDSRFWVPDGERAQLSGPALNDLEARLGGRLDVIARLRPGTDRAQAQAELDAVAKRFALAYPKEDKGLGFHIEPAGSLLPPQKAMFGSFLTALSVVTFLVLCIAVSNVANLLLVRAAARHTEMAVRTALGATRWELVRPILLESTLLALAGGVFGSAFCLAAVHAFTAIRLPVFAPIDLSLDFDWRVNLYAFVLSTGGGILCGIAPAFSASRPMLPNSLKGENALNRPGRRSSLRTVLVVVQISLCLVLLCTTGLFLRSLRNSAGVDPGFRTTNVLMLSIDPAHNGYVPGQTSLLLRRLHESTMKIPGVKSAAWTDKVPLSFYGQGGGFHKLGSKVNPDGEIHSEIYGVGEGFFETMGITWVAGRDFTTADPNAPRQAVVNERFVRMVFGGGNVIGEHVVSEAKTYEIVGVVKDTKSTTVAEVNEPIAYRVLEQDMDAAAPFMGFSLAVRYQGNPAEIAGALHSEIHAVDPALAIFAEKTMGEHLSDALFLPKVAFAIFAIFGLSGLSLALVGLYGVMSYTVNSRTREIGIRLALGATQARVQWLIVRQGMLLACVALGVGLPISLAASKITARVLYGVAPYDWVTFTAVPCFLAVVSLLACWLPAHRAASVEPQTVLRHE